jgi:hypothetical protein
MYDKVSISSDGRLLAAGGPSAVALWDFPTGKELAFLPGSPYHFAAFKNGSPRQGGDPKQEETLLITQANGLFRRTIHSEK